VTAIASASRRSSNNYLRSITMTVELESWG